MTATNYDDQLGEIYRTMLNELNCTFSVSFSRFHCCGRVVMVCGRHGIGPNGSRDVIEHVIIRFATCHFLQVLYCNRV